MSVFDYATYPFRVSDIALSEYNNGFVYMFVSITDPLFVYIGETKCIRIRLKNHNSAHGSSTTTPLGLQLYAVVAYNCRFDGNNILRRHIKE